MSATDLKTEQYNECVKAFQQLYYSGLINEKEQASIKKKINSKFKPYPDQLAK